MAVTTVAALSNQYQKYFSKVLLETAVAETIMDQWAQTGDLPKNMGAKTISFFRRKKAVLNSSGLVSNVVALTEGTPISQFSGYTMDRIDVTLEQMGEATKITDIAGWTELFDAMVQSSKSMGEDCALNNDGKVRDAFVQASTGINGGRRGRDAQPGVRHDRQRYDHDRIDADILRAIDELLEPRHEDHDFWECDRAGLPARRHEAQE